MTKIRQLHTVDEVLEELGLDEVMRLTGHNVGAINMWRYGLKSLPLKTYAVLKHALKRKGCEAPDELWRKMIPIKEGA